MKQFIHWLVMSSANADDIGLTIYGAITWAAPTVLYALGILHVQGIDASTVSSGALLAQAFIVASLHAIGATITLVGFIRKLWLTVVGKNAVLASPRGTMGGTTAMS